MSGAEVAAYIGLLDVSIRGISSINKVASNWKHAPRTMEALAEETSTLQRNLSDLANLQRTNSETLAIAERVGLSGAVAACGDHCARLNKRFARWESSTSRYRIKARFHYISHRNELTSLLTEIQTAKQTTILSILVAQLSLCLQSLMSSEDQKVAVASTIREIEGTKAKIDCEPQQEQAIKEAEKQLEKVQVTMKYLSRVDGDDHVIGVKAAESQNVLAGVVNTFVKGKINANSKNIVVGISLG